MYDHESLKFSLGGVRVGLMFGMGDGADAYGVDWLWVVRGVLCCGWVGLLWG